MSYGLKPDTGNEVAEALSKDSWGLVIAFEKLNTLRPITFHSEHL